MEDLKSKGRYWTAILYPESMIEDWAENLDNLLEFPYAYCVHDKDCDENGEIRKTHVHFIVAYSNSTTKASVLKLFSRLGVIHTCEQVRNVRNAYNYLIHDSDDSRKKHKYQYEKEERICGNNFDIGNYEQLSIADKQKIKRDLMKEIVKNDFQDFWEMTLYIYERYEDDVQYIDVFESNQSFYNNLVKGNFLHKQRIRNGEIKSDTI